MTNLTVLPALAASAILLCLSACSSAPSKPSGGEETVAAVADRYFEEVEFKYSPTHGTRVGFHQYDTQFEDASRSAVEAHLAALKDYERRIEAVRPSASEAVDRELLLSEVRSGILELETVRSWEKDPDIYSGRIAHSAFVIMSRNFAPPDERLRSLVAREKQMPAALDAGRANLKNPPRQYTEIALEQLPGIVAFFERDVPAAFKDAKDQATLREFAQTNAQVIAALRSYEQFLRTDVLPRSKGDYRIGADTYRKKLAIEEMVEIPLDELLKIGFADLRKNQREFQRIASLLSPGQSAQNALSKLGADHPPPGELLHAFRATFSGLREFIQSHRVVTILEKASGKTHPGVATALNNLASVLRVTNRLGEAEQAHRRSLAVLQQVVDAHPEIPEYRSRLASCRRQLGACYLKMAKPAEAERELLQAVALDQGLSQAHPDVIRAYLGSASA